MDLNIGEIWLKGEERLRDEYGDLKGFAQELHLDGQLQDILIRPLYPTETPPDGKKWVVVDGARRYLATLICAQAGLEIPYLETGSIGVKFRAEESELKTLELEYRANNERKDFSWKEKGDFIRRIHEGNAVTHEKWSAEDTANLLRMGEMTVYKYLLFYSDMESFLEDKVQNADTFNTAYKQFQIAKEINQRERLVAHREKRYAEQAQKVQGEAESGVETDALGRVQQAETKITLPSEFAQLICQCHDCREWLPQLPDNSFDWFHWDPPYGGEQGGGAFTQFGKIDDSWVYARGLMQEMIPHIWRTLRDGRWIALWYHPRYYNELILMLQGHEIDWEYIENEGIIRCVYCCQEWEPHKLSNPCRRSPTPFWVNPYPNIWYKVDRKSAGQEIRRFPVNAQEHFFFACAVKSDETKVILPKTDRQNVFTYVGVSKDERRHVMHKPVELLSAVLECISIKGELGCDPSFGSGSSIEAALASHRKIVACELDRQSRNSAVEAIEKCVKENGIEPYQIDFS